MAGLLWGNWLDNSWGVLLENMWDASLERLWQAYRCWGDSLAYKLKTALLENGLEAWMVCSFRILLASQLACGWVDGKSSELLVCVSAGLEFWSLVELLDFWSSADLLDVEKLVLMFWAVAMSGSQLA